MTNSITLTSVIDRINASNMKQLRKEFYIQNATNNSEREDVLMDIINYCNTFDADFAANARKRETQSFNVKTDNWEAPAPDMTKSHMSVEDKRKAASDEVKAKLLARRQARKQAEINKKLEFGVGFHEVVVVDGNICSNDDFMWIKIRDIRTNLTTNFTWYIGEEDSKLSSDKLVKYMRSEDETIPTIDECGDELDWIDEMAKSEHVFTVHASISKYDNTKLYIMFNHFDKILDAMDEEENPKHPEMPEAEDVGYKDEIGCHNDKGMARRPVEDEVCYDDDQLAEHIYNNRKGMLSF